MDKEKLWRLLKKIPKGKVTTYKQLAIALGASPRAIGSMLRSNKNPNTIPCYKVVSSNGGVGGYSLGVKEKIKRLKSDGIKTKNKRIENFNEKLVIWSSGGWI